MHAPGEDGRLIIAELSKLPKTTLQVRHSYDEDAMLIFLEIRKYGRPCIEEEEEGLGGEEERRSFFPLGGVGRPRLLLLSPGLAASTLAPDYLLVVACCSCCWDTLSRVRILVL